MKKLLQIVLISALFSYQSFAQLVTITETYQMPAIGDTIHYQDANTFGFDPVGTGPITDKLWDFGSLMNTSTLDFWYVDAATTPDGSSFPNANLAKANSSEAGYFYYEANGNDIARWGWYASAANYGIYDNSVVEFTFPFTAGDNNFSTYSGEFSPLGLGEDSITIEDGEIVISADAQGTLILPNGTFNNVLRIHLFEEFRIKAYMEGLPVMNSLIEDDYYYWFHDTILQPVLIYGKTFLNSSEEAEVLRYQPIDLTTHIDETDIVFPKIDIYPNPSSGIVNISSFENIDNIEIYDVLGKLIYNSDDIVNNFLKLDISDYPDGLYLIKIKSSDNYISKKILLIK